jgi:aldose 1-epimerase
MDTAAEDCLPIETEKEQLLRPTVLIGALFLIAANAGCAVVPGSHVPSTEGKVRLESIQQSVWGEVDGKPVTLFTLRNKNGLLVKIANYGGIITELDVPDRTGALGDIVLGFDDVTSYVKSSPYFGAIIGRIANRISGAQFQLDGVSYQLAANNGKNSLHGGLKGWDKVIWDAKAFDTSNGPSLQLSYTSKDGEEGFPGTVKATNTYTLTNANELKVEMRAETDRLTVVNMAHHSYFNLAGHAAGTVLEQVLKLNASSYTPNDPALHTVAGQVEPVTGTPFDFTKPKPIGQDLKAAGGDPIGFDSNWIVDGPSQELRDVAEVKDPHSGRVLKLKADQPGVQFYSGNYLDGTLLGKGANKYPQYAGFCLETQRFPNAINVPAWRDQVLLKPGKPYTSTMIFSFSTE